jgi:hypothetical protein
MVSRGKMAVDGRGHAMEWTFLTHEEDGYLEVVTSGVVDAENTIEMAKAVAQTMRSRLVRKAIIDHRNVAEVLGGTSAAYNRPKIFRFIGLSLGIKIAEIIRSEHDGHFIFFESICMNQGFQLAVFHDKETALTWLLK